MEIINKLLEYYEKNSTKVHLILVNVLLTFFAIIFSNTNLLPFKSIGDFAIFVLLGLVLAIYRPTWSFAFLIGSLVLENVALAPAQLGISLKPYQYFLVLTLVAFSIQIIKKKNSFPLPKWKWFDLAILFFAFSGFVSAFGALQKGTAFKQAVIVVTYVLLYVLIRIFIQTFDDAKRMLPFFLSSSVVVMLFGIWQNIRFLFGRQSFEVMPGRPNATFPEADWLGMFLVFVFAICLAVLYKAERKYRIDAIILLVLSLVTLIIAVSRSAWLGAFFVSLVFLKMKLTNGKINPSQWNWKKFANALLLICSLTVSSLLLVLVFHLTNFQLFNRAQSTGSGLQKITIACPENRDAAIPEKIGNLQEVERYGCRHINLEDIDKEKFAGNLVLEVYRPDPNVGIRGRIYRTSFEQIKQYPIFGIGWGNISSILGNDERGAGLNASNLFLEVWLGSGIMGLISLLAVLMFVLLRTVVFTIKDNIQREENIFVMLAFFAIMIPNLFNSGILLAYFWSYLAIAVSLMTKNAPHQIPNLD